MNNQEAMQHALDLTLVKRYECDSSITYGLTYSQLHVLMNHFGEMEPIIDAINELNDVSVEERARDIGCAPHDFWVHKEDELIADLVKL